jgi:Protein of unknown function (DUF3105)
MAAKGKTAAKSPGKSAGKTASKSTKGRRGAPPPIVVNRPKPWGLIAATVAMVVFAGAVIGYAVMQNHKKAQDKPEARASDAAKIESITVVQGLTNQHVTEDVKYAQTPPVGGNHDPEWADCTGTVYPNPIRDQNAVHALEHGAVWITYQPGLDQADVDKLKKKVEGNNYMMMSPYTGLKTKVSLQAWGHQLFVDSPDDPRVDRFIHDLRQNASTIPEYGATCEDPDFKNAPLKPGDKSSAASGSTTVPTDQPAP